MLKNMSLFKRKIKTIILTKGKNKEISVIETEESQKENTTKEEVKKTK